MDAESDLRALGRLVLHLEQSQHSVTSDHVRIVASEWGLLTTEAELDALLTSAIEQLVLFTDTRTAYDRTTATFSSVRLYRVNPRHPFVLDARGGQD